MDAAERPAQAVGHPPRGVVEAVHLVEDEAFRIQAAQDGPPAPRAEVDGEVERRLTGRESEIQDLTPSSSGQTMPVRRRNGWASSAFPCR